MPSGHVSHSLDQIFTALGVEGVLLVLKFFETLQGFEPTTADPAAFGEGVFAVGGVELADSKARSKEPADSDDAGD
jgi:hypothetical protein